MDGSPGLMEIRGLDLTTEVGVIAVGWGSRDVYNGYRPLPVPLITLISIFSLRQIL